MDDIYKRTQRRNVDKFIETLSGRLNQLEQGELSLSDLFQYYQPELNSFNNAKRASRRGITVHPKLMGMSNVEFLSKVVAEIGPRTNEKWSLDRINNAEFVYDPNYLRWSDSKGQAGNRTSTNIYELVDPNTGEVFTTTVRDWVDQPRARRLGITMDMIHDRIRRGCEVQDAFFRPKGMRRFKNDIVCNSDQPASLDCDASLNPRCYSAFERSRLDVFPTAPRRLDPKGKHYLKNCIHDWQKQGADPEAMIRTFFKRYGDLKPRLRASIANLRPVPSAHFMMKYKDEIFEAIQYLKIQDARQVEDQRTRQEINALRQKVDAEQEADAKAFDAWMAKYIVPRLESRYAGTLHHKNIVRGDYASVDPTGLSDGSLLYRSWWDELGNPSSPPTDEVWDTFAYCQLIRVARDYIGPRYDLSQVAGGQK